MSDDLDFSQPAGAAKPAPAAAPAQAPIYIPAIARAFFESAGKEEAFAPGTVIFAENEKASRILLKRDKMYYLLEGEVSLLARGKPIGTPKPGEIFGEMATISDSPRSATAVARSACRVLSLDDEQFAAALAKKPEFALMMLGTMIGRLRGMIAQLSGVPSAPAGMKESRVFDKTLMASSAQSVSATALAARGDWSTSAISPNTPPGPTRSTTAPRIEIATRPSATTYIRAPAWPATMMTLPRS